MKCPKCGYHSFEHLEACKKCGIDLVEHKTKFNLRGFYAPGQTEAQIVDEYDAEVATEAAEGSAIDFGFDFLDEDGPDVGSGAPESAAEAAATAEEDAAMAEAFNESDEFVAAAAESFSLDDDTQVNIDQPFGADSETIPADGSEADPAKKEPGSEFSF